MEKAMILAELKALKEAGVEVGSYMDVMQTKVLQEILNTAKAKQAEAATEPAKTKPETDKAEKAKAARRKVAEKSVEDKKKAAEAKKKSPGKLTLRGVRDTAALKAFLKQDDKVLLDTSPTNILDKCLYNSGRGMKVSNAHKKFLTIIEKFNKGKKEDDQFKALQKIADVKSHIRYREETDGWIFNREGDTADPKIRLVGMDANLRGVKVADRPTEEETVEPQAATG